MEGGVSIDFIDSLSSNKDDGLEILMAEDVSDRQAKRVVLSFPLYVVENKYTKRE